MVTLDNINGSFQEPESERGLPWWRSGRESACQCSFAPWAGKSPWRRKWQPTPVSLSGKSHGQRSLAGYSPWGHQESDTTEGLNTKVRGGPPSELGGRRGPWGCGGGSSPCGTRVSRRAAPVQRRQRRFEAYTSLKEKQHKCIN